MTVHAEYTLRRTRVPEILNLPLAVSASETLSTECLIARENGQIFDLVAAGIATVGAFATDQGAVAE